MVILNNNKKPQNNSSIKIGDYSKLDCKVKKGKIVH